MKRRNHIKHILSALGLPLLAAFLIGMSFLAGMFFEESSQALWVEPLRADAKSMVDGIEYQAGEGIVTARLASPANLDVPSLCHPGSVMVVLDGAGRLDQDAILELVDSDPDKRLTRCSGVVVSYGAKIADAQPRRTTGWQLALALVISAGVVGVLYVRRFPQVQGRPLVSRIADCSFGAGTAFLILMVSWLLSRYKYGEWSLVSPDPSLNILSISQVLSAVVLLPIIEELAFRSWLIPIARTAMRPAFAAILSAGSFALLHFSPDPSNILFYFAAGLMLAGLWLFRRSLLACVVAHGLYNLAALWWAGG